MISIDTIGLYNNIKLLKVKLLACFDNNNFRLVKIVGTVHFASKEF